MDHLGKPGRCWTSDKVAEIVGTARAQREAARRSRQVARAHLERAERNCRIARRHREELIGRTWQVRSAHYDRYGAVVAMWSGESGPPDGAADDTSRGITLDRLVQRLFEAGLTVTSCTTLADARVAARLESVSEMLDSMIHDLRQAVFETHTPTAIASDGAGTDG